MILKPISTFSWCLAAGTLAGCFTAMAEPATLTRIDLPDWRSRCETYRSDGVKADFLRDKDVRRTGKFSLGIRHLDLERGTALHQTAPIPAGEGCTYAASAWVKRRAAAASIALRFLDEQNAYIDGPQEGAELEGDGDWQELTVTAVAPPGTVALRVFMLGRLGECWFDDLSLRDDLPGEVRKRLARQEQKLTKLNLLKSHRARLVAGFAAIRKELDTGVDRKRLLARLRNLNSDITGGINLVVLPSQGIARINVQAPHLADGSPVTGLEVTCSRAADGRTIGKVAKGQWKDGRGSAEIDLRALPPDDYTLTVALRAGARTIDTGTCHLNKLAEPWLEELEADIDKVPWPWTEVSLREGKRSAKVSVWGREYLFKSSTLPEQIVTRGANILEQPIRWRVRTAEREIALDLDEREVESSEPTALLFRGAEHGGGLEIQAKVRVEFDGMIWYECSMTQQSGAPVQRLDLVIPLRPEHARYRHFPGHKPSDRADTGENNVTAGKDFTRALPKYGFCWLGDEERGLNWFFDNPSQFLLDDPEQAVTIRRDGEAMSLEICFVDHPVSWKKPVRFAFGLQPTPTRPLPDGWRLRGNQQWVGEDWVFPWTKEAWSQFGAGFPKSNDPALYRMVLAYHRRHHSKVAPFAIMTWRDRQSPLFNYYREDWAIPGAISDYSKTRSFWFGNYICAQSESYRAWLPYMLRRFVADYNLDGLYHDIQEPHFCTNENHGCAPGRWDTMGMRKLNRRIYSMLHENNRPRMKIDHSSALLHDAIACFADVVVSGEELCADGIDNPSDIPPHLVYDDYFKVPGIRAHLIATGMIAGQRGPIPLFLPEFRVNYKAGTRGLMALLLPCDGWNIWQGRSDFQVMHALGRAARDFGLGKTDVEFHGYWSKDLPVRISTDNQAAPEVRTSVWSRPGHGALVVVANHNLDRDIDTRITLDLPRLGLADGAEAADAEHRLQWLPTRGTIRARVKAKDYRLFWLRPGMAAGSDTPEIPMAAESHIAGRMPELADAQQVVTAGRLAGGATTRFAQPITFRSPVRVTAVSLLLGEKAEPWDFKTVPQPAGTVNPFLLRDPRIEIIRPAADGTPGGDIVAPHHWISYTECRPQDKEPRYRTFHFDRFVDLEAGTYLLVLSKDAEREDRSHVLYWHAVPITGTHPAMQFDGTTWTPSDLTAAVGVYGYQRK